MQTIRKKLALLLVTCSILGIVFTWIFVNITVNNKFNQYIVDIQNKRYVSTVDYFQDIYNKEGKWTSKSGIDMMHEAYMGNYCLTLYDSSKKVIWGMDPNDIRFTEHLKHMNVKDRGVYNSKEFQIKNNGKIVGFVNIGQYSSVLLSEEDVNFKSSINKSIIISCLTTIFIITIISLYFSKQFSVPIKEISNMSVRLSKGDFNARFNNKSNILELENLRDSINILGEKLNHQGMLRRQLVSDISHEIRTPLNVLQNNLEAMIDGVIPVTIDKLNALNEEVIRFGRLIGNLNTLKKFEDESTTLNFENIKLNELISNVCNDFIMVAKEKNIEVIFDVDKNKKYEILGDKDKLKQVFINLLSNAIKFTSSGGQVFVNLYADKKDIIVEIKDNGVGISKDEIPFIFESMYRGDKSRKDVEGSGIGLTVVKDILNLHLVSIEVESKEGEGSCFRVFFQLL